jgi:hypothetical protein
MLLCSSPKYPENSSDHIFAEWRRHREMPITYRFDALAGSMCIESKTMAKMTTLHTVAPIPAFVASSTLRLRR